MKVTRVPRGTVRLVGQTALFTIRNVVAGFGMFEQVMFDEGAVPESFPQPATLPAAAAVMATATAILTHVITSPLIRPAPGPNVAFPSCPSRLSCLSRPQ